MTDVNYEVVYVARSPASMPQDEFAALVDEACNGRAGEGWWLVSTAGDYGANLTLGVWLYFAREASSASGADVAPAAGLDEDSEEPLIESGADEEAETGADADAAPAAGLDEDSDESSESSGKRWWG